MDEMRANAEPLDILHDQFIEWYRIHPIPVASYAENVGLLRTRRFLRPLPLGLVVPRASANPGLAGHTVRDVDDDHLTLVKPPDREHDVYAGVVRFVRDALEVGSLEPGSSSDVRAKPSRELHQRGQSNSSVQIADTEAKAGNEPSSAQRAFRADISRIIKYAPAELIGRETHTKRLADAWDQAVRGETPRPHVLTFVALGGEGKTSLVAKWAAALAHQGWPGCDAVLAWSFYSQGTREQTAVSSDVFLNEALSFFGDAAMAQSAQGAFDKGRRVAQLAGARRALLILDGLEPLQYAPTSPTPGELKDQGIAALLTGLAAINHGLCVVTTRYSIPELRAYWQTTAPEQKLLRLSADAGVALLRTLGVHGHHHELDTLVADVHGHALTLNLLGTFLRDAHAGDIRRRDLVTLEEADAEEQGGHALRVMDAYVRSFETGGQTAEEHQKGQRALALLRLLGLFDRPATADGLEAVWNAPAISGLTEPLQIEPSQLNIALTRLEDAKLLTVHRDAANRLLTLDAHPLIREYFGQRVRATQLEAWRAAHRRLYEHLCATTQEGDQPTLEDLQPLFQAVAHGCQAGLQEEARAKVYRDRIQRGQEAYSTKKLGALGSDLGAVACFFETPWSRVSPALTDAAQAWLLNEAAFRLRALGRLTEALEPMRATMEINASKSEWRNAAVCAGNLSELELTLGEVAGAVGAGEQAVTYADRSGDASERMLTRTTHADALHQAGRRVEAVARFREAEQMQAERQPAYPLLYSVQGFQYCDLLLTEAERGAWEAVRNPESGAQDSAFENTCRVVSERAAQTLKSVTTQGWLLDIALDHLTLGRAALYASLLEFRRRRGESAQSSSGLSAEEQRGLTSAVAQLDAAVDGLRRASVQHHIPRSLLTRAWLRGLTGPRTGPDSAQRDLDEAWDIAERGPMPLFLADIHLHRARLFHAVTPYPWESPQKDLAEARRRIEKHGYLAGWKSSKRRRKPRNTGRVPRNRAASRETPCRFRRPSRNRQHHESRPSDGRRVRPRPRRCLAQHVATWQGRNSSPFFLAGGIGQGPAAVRYLDSRRDSRSGGAVCARATGAARTSCHTTSRRRAVGRGTQGASVFVCENERDSA